MLFFSIVSNLKSKKFLGKIKSIYNFVDSDDPSNHRRSTCKKSRCDTIGRRFLQSIWLLALGHLLKKTKTMLYKNKKAMIHSVDRKNKFFRHYCWNFAKRFICGINVFLLNRSTSNDDRSHKRKMTLRPPQKNPKQTITSRNYKRHRVCKWSSVSSKYTCHSQLPVWSKQQETLASTWPQIKQSSRVLNKKEPFLL